MNNLLERLHASFFFYILTSPEQFLKIGLYLPSAILISVALMIKGLSTWVEAASTIPDVQEKATHIVKASRRRKRPIVTALSIVIGTHVSGTILFAIISSRWFLENHEVISIQHLPTAMLTSILQDFFIRCLCYIYGSASPISCSTPANKGRCRTNVRDSQGS